MNFVSRLQRELRTLGFRAAGGMTLSFEQLDAVVGRAFHP
jgi:hypothetical protein